MSVGLGAAPLTVELPGVDAICNGFLRLMRQSLPGAIRFVTTAGATTLLVPGDPTRVGLLVGHPDAGTIRVSPNSRLGAANEGIAIGSTGETAMLSVWTFGALVFAPWYVRDDGVSRTLIVYTLHLPCGD